MAQDAKRRERLAARMRAGSPVDLSDTKADAAFRAIMLKCWALSGELGPPPDGSTRPVAPARRKAPADPRCVAALGVSRPLVIALREGHRGLAMSHAAAIVEALGKAET